MAVNKEREITLSVILTVTSWVCKNCVYCHAITSETKCCYIDYFAYDEVSTQIGQKNCDVMLLRGGWKV